MDRSTRTWIVPLLLGAAVIIAFAVTRRGDRIEQRSLNQPVDELRHEQIDPALAITQAQKPSLSCPGPRLEVVLNASIESVCLGAVITKHNGSVRSYQVATVTAPQRWLRVEVAGGSILSAAWGSDLRPDFQCQAAECEGIAISRRDAQGARVLTLERTQLSRTHLNAVPPRHESLQLSGRLDIPAEELPALACAGQGLSIVTSDSSSQTFCPLGGAGFEIGDDGNMRYRFTSLDGESIVVATDTEQRIRQIQFEGEVSLACRSFQCSSVLISSASEEGARRFTFAGTTLIEADSGQSNAVLNGSLILPPL